MMSITIIGLLLLCIACVSCGIIRQEDIPLLANERISKRSIMDTPPLLSRQKRTLHREQLRTPILEDLEPAANTAMVYYRRRRARSADVVPLLRDDDQNVSDLDLAENVVFFPMFRTTRRFIKRRNARDLRRAYSFPTMVEEKKPIAEPPSDRKVGQDGSKMRIQ